MAARLGPRLTSRLVARLGPRLTPRLVARLVPRLRPRLIARLAPGLAECENAVLLPHLGSGTVEAREAMGRLAVDAIAAVLSGREPEYALV